MTIHEYVVVLELREGVHWRLLPAGVVGCETRIRRWHTEAADFLEIVFLVPVDVKDCPEVVRQGRQAHAFVVHPDREVTW